MKSIFISEMSKTNLNMSSIKFNKWPEIIKLIRKCFNKSRFALSGLIIDSTWSIQKSYFLSLCLLLHFHRLHLPILNSSKSILNRQQSLSLQERPKVQFTMTLKITERLSLVKTGDMIDIVVASLKIKILHATTLSFKVNNTIYRQKIFGFP